MTESVARIARAAGARCYTDPFLSSAASAKQAATVGRLAGWLNNPPRSPTISQEQTVRTGAHRVAAGNSR
jgi:3-phenylpropionate/trans-cinnamate dioxygenase ferredoxin reductase subunit